MVWNWVPLHMTICGRKPSGEEKIELGKYHFCNAITEINSAGRAALPFSIPLRGALQAHRERRESRLEGKASKRAREGDMRVMGRKDEEGTRRGQR